MHTSICHYVACAMYKLLAFVKVEGVYYFGLVLNIFAVENIFCCKTFMLVKHLFSSKDIDSSLRDAQCSFIFH